MKTKQGFGSSNHFGKRVWLFERERATIEQVKATPERGVTSESPNNGSNSKRKRRRRRSLTAEIELNESFKSIKMKKRKALTDTCWS